jgi:murein L,D-transpeptidase YcbB/YkuD
MKTYLIILTFFLTNLYSDSSGSWVNGLNTIQENNNTKKSYLTGMLIGKSYGEFSVENFNEQDLVQEYYLKNGYKTIWIDDEFSLNPNFFNMISMIKNAYEEALNPQRYHLSEVSNVLNLIKQNTLSKSERNLIVIKLDILMTDAFFSLMKDLNEGIVPFSEFNSFLVKKSEQNDIDYKWEEIKKDKNYIKKFESFLENNQELSLSTIASNNEMYIALKEAYFKYQRIADEGGWEKIPNVGTLKKGKRSRAVPILARRLYLSGDLLDYDPSNKRFTQEIKDGLKHFQKRNGIWASGVMNSTTRKALNISVEKRLKKIRLNFERSRWEKSSFGDEYIMVNIPEFRMRFIRNLQEDVSMRVVVGKKENPTPIFSSKMSYVVINPYWKVPNSIAVKELIPKIQEDPDYLDHRDYKTYSSWGKDKKVLDSFDIDWYQYDENSKLPFCFVKEPGSRNPLGNVKFMFPNRYAVYMHDTPQKKYFKKSVRAFSHGCIRLAEPRKLLEFVSNNYMMTPFSEVKSFQKTGENKSMKLDKKIPVYVRYYTTTVNPDGGVRFFNDIYGYDRMQLKLIEDFIN